MPIYTRTGDKGETSLFNKQRVSKADVRVEAYGTIDELNSAIGVAIAELLRIKDKGLRIKRELIKIQNDLLEIGSALANPANSEQRTATSYLAKRVKEFEDFIDKMTEKMPKLANFILPGGGKAGSMLHLARAISRRAERRIVALNSEQKIDNNIIIYMNRLSDLLFTMARFVNFKEKKKEVIWIKR